MPTILGFHALALKFIHLLEHIITLFLVKAKEFPPCNKSISFYYEQNFTAQQEHKTFMKKGQFLPPKSILFICQQNCYIPPNTEICFKRN
jgi:hypothetical protein